MPSRLSFLLGHLLSFWLLFGCEEVVKSPSPRALFGLVTGYMRNDTVFIEHLIWATLFSVLHTHCVFNTATSLLQMGRQNTERSSYLPHLENLE